MRPAVIHLENVSKKFTLHHQRARSLQDALINFFHRRNGSKEEFWALRGVDITVRQGEAVGIVGRNGSGKSTVLKLITRILEPTSGRVAVDGKVSALIELGAGFHPDLTGRENIYLNGSILGLGKKDMDRKFAQIVDFSGLERFIDTPVKHYSSGMYTRLGFAVAISVDPSILIIDEVLSVGDESFQRKCMDKIRDFNDRGVTIVFVSHSLDAVRNLCDRAIWLDGGRVRQQGGALAVVEGYLADSNTEDQIVLPSHEPPPRPAMEDGARRWGSREVEISRVRILDGEGRERRRFVSGDPLVVRMEYVAHREVVHPVFGIALYAENGAHITGPNTDTGNASVPLVRGQGHVDYIVDHLPLVSGRYRLSVAVYDRTLTHAFDHQHAVFHFDVLRGAIREDFGLVRIPCRWSHVSDADPAAAAEPIAVKGRDGRS